MDKIIEKLKAIVSEFEASKTDGNELISAEEARKLGAGKAEWYAPMDKTWNVCDSHFTYTEKFEWRKDPYFGVRIKYRAIKQPEPVEQINHIELLGEIYGFLQSICPEGIADEAFRIVPEAIRAQAIAKYVEPSDALGERVRHTQEAGRAEVEPHAELKAMYEQQVKDGTVDDFFWEYKPHNSETYLEISQYADFGKFYQTGEYRCTPKPTCQVKNLDTGKTETMTREAAKLLQAETKDVCDWVFPSGETIHPAGGLVYFSNEGIYTYKLRPLKQISWKDVPVGVALNLKESSTKFIYCGLTNYGNILCIESASRMHEYATQGVELAPAGQQPWIPVIAPPEGITVEYSRFHECLRITGIAKGWELK